MCEYWLKVLGGVLSIVMLTWCVWSRSADAVEGVQVTPPTVYRIAMIRLDFDRLELQLELRSPTGADRTVVYQGEDAEFLIKTLNTSDLATRSLQQRLMDRITEDSVLVGTVVGLPEVCVPDPAKPKKCLK